MLWYLNIHDNSILIVDLHIRIMKYYFLYYLICLEFNCVSSKIFKALNRHSVDLIKEP